MLACWRTTQVVHLLLLQQADVVIVSIQYQFCLWALTGHSRATENNLRLHHFIDLQICDNKYGKRGHKSFTMAFEGKVYVKQCSHMSKQWLILRIKPYFKGSVEICHPTLFFSNIKQVFSSFYANLWKRNCVNEQNKQKQKKPYCVVIVNEQAHIS